jgi:flagella basal body P-ring formation protein FlgA
MRCCNRSIPLFANTRIFAVLAMAAFAVAPAGAEAVSVCPDVAVKAAIRSAIEKRMERPFEVTLEDFTCALTSDAPQALAAKPDPSARTGQAVRFVITTAGAGVRGYPVELGRAAAIVHVSGDHVRTRRSMPAGGTLTADDLEVAHGLLDGLPLRRLPILSDLLGARLLRGLAAGGPVAADAVAIAPIVHVGDDVRLTVHLGDVEATVTGVAAQTASRGQIIRVVNASSRRALRARVTAPGEGEVVR